MYSDFSCTRNSLITLNFFYIIISAVLIAVGAYAKVAGVVTSISIAGGLIVCGAFLFLLAMLGIVGTLKHHQVLLFFYMVILFLLFVIQFSIAIAALSTSTEGQKIIAEQIPACCPAGEDENCCTNGSACSCLPCSEKLSHTLSYIQYVGGGTGLFFSLTEILGFLLAYHYRNVLNPKANPHALL